MKRLIVVVYFIEVGLLLVLLPWSAFWVQNYFVEWFPILQNVVRNNYVRGGVSGLGLVNLLTGFYDLADVLMARRFVAALETSDHPSVTAS